MMMLMLTSVITIVIFIILKTKYQQKNTCIFELRKQLDDLSKQITTNSEKEKTNQQQKDAKINELRSKLDDQSQQITINSEKEKANQQSKDALIKDLRKQLDDQAKQTTINQDKQKASQQSKDSLIKDLRKQLDDQSKQIPTNSEKEKAIQQSKDAQINELKRQLEDLALQMTTNLEQYKTYQQSQDTCINQLRQDIEDQIKYTVTNLEKESAKQQSSNTIIQELKEQMQNYDKIIESLEMDKEQLTLDLLLLKKSQQDLKQEKDELNSLVYQKEESQYGYDIIIKMKSIRELENNNQETNQLGGLQVQQFDQNFDSNLQNVKVIGLQGQRNKGKTFILNSLIDDNFPSDYHLSTPGICLKHHKIDGKNILYIDSEGLNRPITFNFEENNHYRQFIDNQKNNTGDCEDNQNEQNLEKDITQQHWDLKATEQIQQEFILQSSNILLIVVSHLTLEDQKLIHTLTQRFVKDIKNPKQKQIFVVHNLKEYRRVEYLQDYFEELKKIFPVRQQVFDNIPKKYDDENNYILIDNVKPFVNHIVMGFQNSEAGRVYNRFALEYLKFAVSYNQSITNFHVQQKLYEYLNKNLRYHVSLKMEQSDETQQASLDDQILEFNKKEQRILLKNGWLIDKIKEQQVNIFGSFEKDCYYSLVNSDKNVGERVLIIELPGSIDYKSKFDKKSGQFTIVINQSRSLESEIGEIYSTTRKFEEKYHTIQVCDQNEIWYHDKSRIVKGNNGIVKFYFVKEIEDDFQ